MSAERSPVPVVVTILAFSLLLTAPFFALGRDSAVGWYDETDATIPWTLIYSREPRRAFIHEWAGGVGVSQNFLQGSERVSLLPLLERRFPPVGALALDRFAFFSALLAGLYLSCRRIVGATKKASLLAAAFGVVASPINYGWIAAAGSCWLAAFLAWLGLALTDAGRSSSLLSSLICATIFALAGNPVFMLACAPILAAAVWAMRPPTLRELSRALALGLCLLALFAANYFPTALRSMDYLREVSTRYSGFKGLVPAETRSVAHNAASFGPAIGHVLDVLWDWAENKVATGAIALSLALVLWKEKGRGTALLRGLATICALCGLLGALSTAYPGAAISKFRWTEPMLAFTIVGAWTAARAASLDRVRILAAAAVAAAATVNTALFLRTTISNASVDGGWRVYSDYSNLSSLFDKPHSYRVASISYSAPRASLAPVYGVDAFDGMSTGFCWRRSLFFQKMLRNGANASVHTHHQDLVGTLSTSTVVGLELANVDAVLGTPEEMLKNQARLKHLLLSAGRSVSLPRVLRPLFPALGVPDGVFHVLPALYVWKLPAPWPRVFLASRADVSRFPIADDRYWAVLRSIPRQTALIAASDATNEARAFAPDRAARLVDWKATNDGYEARTNGQAALVVFNQVFDGYWKAACGNRRIPVVPVNGIMTAAMAPSSCSVVDLIRTQAAVSGGSELPPLLQLEGDLPSKQPDARYSHRYGVHGAKES